MHTYTYVYTCIYIGIYKNIHIHTYMYRFKYVFTYSSGQITLDPQNFGRKQQDKKRSICQSYLVVGISHTRLFFLPGTNVFEYKQSTVRGRQECDFSILGRVKVGPSIGVLSLLLYISTVNCHPKNRPFFRNENFMA